MGARRGKAYERSVNALCVEAVVRHVDLVRLVRILGMLGSDHAGERANAALAAHRLVKRSGATWWDLLVPGRVPAMRPQRVRSVEIFIDPVAAAESRMRQMRRENDELRHEIVRLKRSLEVRRTAERKAQYS